MTRLVNIFLRGAADGLNILAPITDPAYRAARPNLALGPEQVIDVGIAGFGLHRSAPGLAGLITEGKVGLVPAAGYAGQTRSHFTSQAILETAVGDDGSGSGGRGWLGAVLDSSGDSTASPFRGVAVGSVSVPASMWGTTDAIGCPDLSTLRLGQLAVRKGKRGKYEVVDSPLAPDPQQLASEWDRADKSLNSVREGVRTAGEVIRLMSESPIAPSADKTSQSFPSQQLFDTASALLDSDLNTQVIQLDLGGWDTHFDQGVTEGRLADLLADLDAGISRLADKHLGKGDGIVISVMTEFGRRVDENASGGTDHGTGGLAFVISDDVVPGLHGKWPGLVDLDNGDVQAANDLRVFQAEVIAKVFDKPIKTPQGSELLGLFRN